MTELETKADTILQGIGYDIQTAYTAFLQKVVQYEKYPEGIQDILDLKDSNVRFEDLCGIFKGKIWMSDDFNDPLDDFDEYM